MTETAVPELREPILVTDDPHFPFTVYDETGTIVLSMMMCYADRELNKQFYPFHIEEKSSPETQYVLEGELHNYTPEELAIKQNLPAGWKWKMPERLAVDERNIEQVKRTKAAEISLLCQEKIIFGFNSDALGTTHHYPAKLTDQQNLSASVLSSLLPDQDEDWSTPFWCAVDDVWSFELHSAAQIQQVGRDAKATIVSYMEINQTLANAIAACTTVAEVDAITWPE